MSQLASSPSFHAPGASFGGAGYSPAWTQGSIGQQQAYPYQVAQPDPYSNTPSPYPPSAITQAPRVAPQRPSASTPPHHSLPNAAAQQSQPNARTPPTQYPMAAPPLPQSPANQQQSQQQPQPPRTTPPHASIASPKSPQSPGSQTLEQQRIALLLSINIDLLNEVNTLQQSGQGGAISAQQQASLKNAGQPDKLASDEYIQCLRRVQANLAYMMPKAQPGQHENSKVPPGPAHMTPPRHMYNQLGEKYRLLKELFPGWQGMEHRMSQGGSSSSPTPNAQAQAQAQAQGQMANGVNNTNVNA